MQSAWVCHSVFGTVYFQQHIYSYLSINEICQLYLACAKMAGLINLHLIPYNKFCCSFLQTNGLPFLIKSYMGFNNFCSSGQNILRKFTIPTKLLHPFTVVGGCSFCIASNLLCRGLTQTLLFFMNISFPMYCKFVLNNMTFLWGYFQTIL